MTNFTQALKHAIQRDGRTQAALWRASGVAEPVISLFTRGRRTITLKTADKLAAALGVEVRLVRRRHSGK